jgi:hypothetical protein
MKTEIKFQTVGTRAVVSKKITPEQAAEILQKNPNITQVDTPTCYYPQPNYLVIDCEGSIMGFGSTEMHAIEDAAKTLQMEIANIEEQLEKSKNGYQGDDETLLLRTRQEWEETSGMTLEEYLGPV